MNLLIIFYFWFSIFNLTSQIRQKFSKSLSEDMQNIDYDLSISDRNTFDQEENNFYYL